MARKLGVASFAEKVFDVNFFKPWSQSEDLIDRLRTLLNGYRDGLSIFRETIQNADDAGATVVKYCYDMRRNNNCRNPKKLLDPNLASTQGPALFVFNDSTFSDQDFENLIKLGGRSKEKFADKIGTEQMPEKCLFFYISGLYLKANSVSASTSSTI